MASEWCFSDSWKCLDCKEAVFNPICPFCLAEHIEIWLSSYPSDIRKKILPQINEYIKKTNNLAGKSTKCIICNKKRVSICPYCFTEYVLNYLKKLKVSNIILKEFLQFFNFDFEHTGYSKEAEKLGVI